MMQLEKIDEVIKASPAIQIQSKITHLQRRAWNVLLANAYSELPDKDIHSVSMVELLRGGMESAEQRQQTGLGRCLTVGIRRDRKRHLHLRLRAAFAPKTS